MWSSLKLKFLVVRVEPIMDKAGPAGWTQDLQQVLNMRRLQALEQLTLDFSLTGAPKYLPVPGTLSWQDCMDFLQIFIGNSPTIRKLSLESFHVALSTTPQQLDELVTKLVKFEEVNFGMRSHYSFLDDRGLAGIANMILRRIAAVGSSGKDSKLKVFSMPGLESCLSVNALAEARKILTVNILKRQRRNQK